MTTPTPARPEGECGIAGCRLWRSHQIAPDPVVSMDAHHALLASLRSERDEARDETARVKIQDTARLRLIWDLADHMLALHPGQEALGIIHRARLACGYESPREAEARRALSESRSLPSSNSSAAELTTKDVDGSVGNTPGVSTTPVAPKAAEEIELKGRVTSVRKHPLPQAAEEPEGEG